MKLFGIYITKKSKLFEIISLLLIFTILSYFLVFSKSNYKIMSDIVDIFLTIVVPSLFPFILFSNILIYSGYFNLLSNTRISNLLQKIFGTSIYGSTAIIFGFLFGYPNGARYVNELYENKKISFKEAEYLLMFVNNSSPAFILSSIGIGMLDNIRIGILLLISHILASLMIGIILKKKYNLKNEKNITKYDISEEYSLSFDAITKSITKTIYTMCMVLGFMTLFILSYNYILKILEYLVKPNRYISCFLLLISELTSGLNDLASLPINLKTLITLISLFLGFSSLSINFQIFSCVYKNKFRLKKLLMGKLLHGIFSALITYILIDVPVIYEYINISSEVFNNIQIEATTSSYTANMSTVILMIYILILFLLLKKKRFKNRFFKGG